MKKKVAVFGGPVLQKIDPVLKLVPTGKGLLAGEIADGLENDFIVKRIGNFPGGECCDFDRMQKMIVNLQADAVVFLPHLPNVLVDCADDKIRIAEGQTFSLNLKPAPKLVKEVKKLHPAILLVPFKLASENQGTVEIISWLLSIHAAFGVVSQLGRKDEFSIVEVLGQVTKVNREELPRLLAEKIDFYLSVIRRRSVKKGDEVPKAPYVDALVKFSRQMQPTFANVLKNHANVGRWPGNFSFRCSYGFLSSRAADGFLITKRDVDKSGLDQSGFVFVEKDLTKNALVYSAKGDAKPSVDAPVHRYIYEHLSWVKSIIHGHVHFGGDFTYPENLPFWPCGAENEAIEIVEVAPKEKTKLWIVNVTQHGFVALIGDDNPEEALKILTEQTLQSI
jgi:ribulose-5-phosphate 4-epimerase/fuculose-1-phosphate aldolase